MASIESGNFGRALRVIDDVWQQLADTLYVQTKLGKPVDRLADLSEAAAARRSAFGRALLARIDKVDSGGLPFDVATTLEVARRRAAMWAREEDYYWLVFDPPGVGFFGLFAPTAYCGGFLLNTLSSIFRNFAFETPGDLDRYLGLVADYARLVDQLRTRTSGQAERGIRMPQVQLDQAIPLMTRLKQAAGATLAVDPARLAALGEKAASELIASRIASEVEPAFDALIADLEHPDYRAAAPEAVGMSQYPGGAEVYAELIHLHTTVDLTASEVHQAGLDRMAAVRADMRNLLDKVGFAGSPADYFGKIEADPAWRAQGEEAIGAVFRRYIDRIAPHIDRNFAFKPAAPHDVAPLPQALTASMTFGYYDSPSPNDPTGRYLFNAENLSNGGLASVAALNYHELVPGHHFHLASQQENEGLHPLRQHSFFNAFNEGWAEYAATLAGEIGMYEQPEERFGRHMNDAFLTCRLVIDTGMNALGWSLEQARDYMRENGFMPETEIRSETIRYSCDIPAQSLAYKLGDTYLIDTREKMRNRLGSGFDIRDFHDAVLKPGGLPLPLVAANVAAETERLAGTSSR